MANVGTNRFFGGVAGIFLALLAGGSCSDSGGGPNVLLVTVDTLRADRIGCFGGTGVDWTPEIDALAADGVLFENAISQSCFTAPAMCTLASGVYPLSHGVMEWGQTGEGFTGPTLPRVLQEAGYRTVMLSGHGGLGDLQPLRGGFDRFFDDGGVSSSELVVLAEEEIEASSSRPLFLWIHLFDPHGPYEPPEELGRARTSNRHSQRLAEVPYRDWTRFVMTSFPVGEQKIFFTRMYDGEIASVDRAVGRIFRAFGDRFPGDWLGALTADHGENLADHVPFFDHRNVLFDSLVRVPLVLVGDRLSTGKPGQRVSGVTETRGLPGFLLAQCDLPFSGPTLDPSLSAPGARAYSDSGWQDDPHKSVRDSRYKVVFGVLDQTLEIYDLLADPGETRDLASSGELYAVQARDGLAAIIEWQAGLRGPAQELPRFSDGVRDRLEALGYLNGKPHRTLGATPDQGGSGGATKN